MTKDRYVVRPLSVSDWEVLKKIRIQAITNHSDVFAPSRHPNDLTKADWIQMLENPASVSFVLIDTNSDDVIGLSGIYIQDGNPDGEVGIFVSTYINDDFKSQGLASLFYEVRIAWAIRHHSLKKLRLEHKVGNNNIKKVHQKFGFQQIGSGETILADGTTSKTEIWELVL